MYVRIVSTVYQFLNAKGLLILTVCKILEINGLAALRKQVQRLKQGL